MNQCASKKRKPRSHNEKAGLGNGGLLKLGFGKRTSAHPGELKLWLSQSKKALGQHTNPTVHSRWAV